MANVHVPPEKQQDSFIVYQTGLTRDAVRTPMQWNARVHAGFSDAANPVEPWLPVADDFESVNVEVLKQDETSVLWLYKRLLELRRNTPALNTGSYKSLDDVPNTCFAYLRETQALKALILLNFSDQKSEVSLPAEAWCVSLSTYLDRDEDARKTISLRPFEGLILIEMHS